MYTPHAVTLFNIEDVDGTIVVYRTYLDGVFLDTAKGRNTTADGVSSTNRATLYIPFSVDGGGSQCCSEKHYVSPRTFHNMAIKSNVWTLEDSGETSAVSCFIIKGKCTESLSYRDAKKKYDNVYAVTEVKERDYGSADMQHWEVSLR